jgi:hypothetical protein
MFRTVPLSFISSLFTVHSAMFYVIQVCTQLSSRSICSCSNAALHYSRLIYELLFRVTNYRGDVRYFNDIMVDILVI